MSTIQPNHTLLIKEGPQELSITNAGSGTTKYEITQGKSPAEKQTLSGSGSQQDYYNVEYPVTIDNYGPDAIDIA